MAPAKTGAQSTDAMRDAVEAGVSVAMAPSPKSDERQYRHDHDDEPDQIDDAVHVVLLIVCSSVSIASASAAVRNLDGEGLAASAEPARPCQNGGAHEDHEHGADQDTENSATVRH
ncbi:hypothetical protein VF02_37990 [Nostoc linckia z1]|nr:hypothetical protein VF02_37990 [Nostoc linckia z1]